MVMSIKELETPVHQPEPSLDHALRFAGRCMVGANFRQNGHKASEDSFVFLFCMRLPNANLFSTVRGYHIYKDIWQCNGLVAVQ